MTCVILAKRSILSANEAYEALYLLEMVCYTISISRKKLQIFDIEIDIDDMLQIGYAVDIEVWRMRMEYRACAWSIMAQARIAP